jgi:hypothetical protein
VNGAVRTPRGQHPPAAGLTHLAPELLFSRVAGGCLRGGGRGGGARGRRLGGGASGRRNAPQAAGGRRPAAGDRRQAAGRRERGTPHRVHGQGAVVARGPQAPHSRDQDRGACHVELPGLHSPVREVREVDDAVNGSRAAGRRGGVRPWLPRDPGSTKREPPGQRDRRNLITQYRGQTVSLTVTEMALSDCQTPTRSPRAPHLPRRAPGSQPQTCRLRG